jgi:hypothetical protein
MFFIADDEGIITIPAFLRPIDEFRGFTIMDCKVDLILPTNKMTKQVISVVAYNSNMTC